MDFIGSSSTARAAPRLVMPPSDATLSATAALMRFMAAASV